ncbi:site-specific integrase [Streptomyces sp. NPDC005438]|uniref:tyrosine-type recombinase/integrase n=1 Tax=Streptomyces sp. NPDC005438 TaxID=3156880 RepID=UPI0033BC39E1
MPNPIKKLPPNRQGQIRYRFVVDAGTDPTTGKRRQLTVTRNTLKEAKAEHARIVHETKTGTLVLPSKVIMADLVAAFLTHKQGKSAATRRCYEDATRYVVTFCGDKPAQKLTEDDVDALVKWMATSARRIGGKPGTGLSARTIHLTLTSLRAVLKLGMRRGIVHRNVAEYTEIPQEISDAAKEYNPWTQPEVKTFLAHVATDRLHAVMLLSLIGLRPAEVCGLRWSDVDLDTGVISVKHTRTLVAGKVVEKATKTKAGERVLPLPDEVLTPLKTFKARQAAEKLAAGEAYEASGFVVVDELGRAVKTDWLRRRTYERMQSAGVRKVRLYDARHTCLSWMLNNGVPDTVVSAWAGHSNLSLAKDVYGHSDPQSLKAGSEKLAELLG